jgi:hypothetical protein
MKLLNLPLLFSGVTTVLALACQTAAAKDLPDLVRVSNLTNSVEVFEVVDARIKKQGYKPRTDTSLSTLKALVEIKVSVQGNICSDSPGSLAVQFVPKDGSDNPEYDVLLTTAGDYSPDPWAIPQACLTYAKNSDVIIPVMFEWVGYEGSAKSKSYAFKTSNGQESRVVLEVTEGNNNRMKLGISIENPR